MSETFTIPFCLSSNRGISARLPEYVGDERNRWIRQFDQHLANFENQFLVESSFQVDQLSPLVLFGPSFTGKSCLAMNFANRVASLLNQNLDEILVLSARDFYLQFAKAVQTKTTKDFRRQFQVTRVIVLDDIQHLGNRNAACDEFQHLLDEFEENGQVLIATANTHPDAISGIGNRLASRLCDGLLLPVNLPGLQSKIQLLDQLGIQQTSQMDLRSDSMSFADLCNFANQSTIGHETPLDEPVDEHAVIEQVLSSTAEKLEISVEDVIGASRMKTIALARCISIYLIRKKLNLSFQQIGKIFSNRDHSTIIHSFNKIQKIIENPNQKQSDVVSLVAELEQNISDCLKPVYACS